MAKVKPYLAQELKDGKYSIFDIDSHMLEISESIQQKLVDDFEEYGLQLKHFFVTSILKPEDDQFYNKFKELHFRQYADVLEANIGKKIGEIESETIANKRKIEGYDYHQERSYDVAEKIAQNEGVGNFSNLGIGLGIMNNVADGVGNKVNKSLEQIQNDESEKDDVDKFKEKIEKLKALKEANLITDEEFEEQKKKLLNNL